MDNVTLEKMQQDYNDVKKVVNGDYSEIEKLEQDPAVKRYLFLKSLKDDVSLAYGGESSAIDYIMRKYGRGEIKDSDTTWFFYFEDVSKELLHAKNVYEYFEEVPDNQMMVVYVAIENDRRIIAISKDKQEEFEREHTVVYGKESILDRRDRYYNEKYRIFERLLSKKD